MCRPDHCFAIFIANLQTEERHLATGRALDLAGKPVPGVQVAANVTYTTQANSEGAWALALPVGANTVTPTLTGYAWIPPNRSFTVPPAVVDQDFAGYRLLRKTALPQELRPLQYDETITYTVQVYGPSFAPALFLTRSRPTPSFSLRPCRRCQPSSTILPRTR